MKNLIDTIVYPLLNWLNNIYNSLSELSVPLSRPVDIAQYLGVFAYLGSGWISFVVNVCLLAFIYVVALLLVAQHGLFIKFKNTVKWW